MKYVVDTSAFFAMEDLPQDAEILVPPGVLSELKKYKDRRLDYWEFKIKITHPSTTSLEAVRLAAQKTGDTHKLSDTDIEVLALAFDLKATILTEDYSIQNVARTMGIDYINIVTRGIKEIFSWEMRCLGCGRAFDKEIKECPVCGSPLKCRRSRKKK
ncbi:MAG: nucleic acid-binding protein [Methanomassiliicoccales archaeon]|jgi:UPF0271 protein|nr:nucleic acid-binding protein [Methanomassiliicoccales archaeon]